MKITNELKLMLSLKKLLLLMGGLVVVALVVSTCVQKSENGIKRTIPIVQPEKELKLSNLPELFKTNTLIIVGDNASEREILISETIANKLKNLTNNSVLIKKCSEVTKDDKANYNLIVIGSPKSNSILREVYEMVDVLEVNETFPGKGRGILEITRNPWNSEKVMLLVEGWDENGIMMALAESYWILSSKIKIGANMSGIETFEGVIKLPLTKVAPILDECGGPAPYLETKNGTKFFLENICPFMNILPGENINGRRIIVSTSLEFLGKFVRIKGIPRKENWSISTINVIIVSDLEIIENMEVKVCQQNVK